MWQSESSYAGPVNTQADPQCVRLSTKDYHAGVSQVVPAHLVTLIHVFDLNKGFVAQNKTFWGLKGWKLCLTRVWPGPAADSLGAFVLKYK